MENKKTAEAFVHISFVLFSIPQGRPNWDTHDGNLAREKWTEPAMTIDPCQKENHFTLDYMFFSTEVLYNIYKVMCGPINKK